MRSRLGRHSAAILDDVGISSPPDLLRRADRVRAFLPRLRRAADCIMEAHPDILHR
jgi:hypothetical protein